MWFGSATRLGDKLDRFIHDTYADWCGRFGPPLDIVSEASSIRQRLTIRPASRTVWANPLELAFYGGNAWPPNAQYKEAQLLQLADVWIVGSEVRMFSGPHTMLQLDSSQSDVGIRRRRRPLPFLARRIDEAVLPLGGRGTGNRGHFLCEHVPRLMLAREKLGTDFPLKILLTPGHASWQSEMLVRLGEDPANMVVGSRGTLLCRDVWFVPNLSPTSIPELYEPEIYKEIARRFKRGLPTRRAERSLFISRRDASTRRMANEDDIFRACQRFFPDLEHVTLSGLSLSDEIDLFAQAKFVIGPIGQPFRGALWCKAALTIQLVPGTRSPDNPFMPWATDVERLGLIHDNRSLSLFSGEPYEGADWVFPLDDFEQALARLAEITPLSPSTPHRAVPPNPG